MFLEAVHHSLINTVVGVHLLITIKKSKFYLLTREQMHFEVELCGAVIHGTKQATANNVNKEYGINFPVYSDKNPTTKRWDDNYISSSYYDIIIDNK